MCTYYVCVYVCMYKGPRGKFNPEDLSFPVVHGVDFLDPKVREIDPSRTNISNFIDLAVYLDQAL